MIDLPETPTVSIIAPPSDDRLHTPTVKESLQRKIDLFQHFAVKAHSTFDQSVWGQNPDANLTPIDLRTPSYHNDHHIEGMIRVTRAFLEAAKNNSKDPFALKEELDKWNGFYSDQQQALTMDEFVIALDLAASGHDLGNLTKTSTVTDKDCLPVLDYSTKYEACVGASVERRSADITESLIDHFFTTEDEKAIMERLKPLVRHLIMQTVFDPEITSSNQCFWQFMQYSDQIGTYYFSDQSRAQSVAGLLNEMRVRGNQPPNLASFLNFPEVREKRLIPDTERDKRDEIHALLKEFGRNGNNIIPEGILGPTNRQVDYKKDILLLMNISSTALTT